MGKKITAAKVLLKVFRYFLVRFLEQNVLLGVTTETEELVQTIYSSARQLRDLPTNTIVLHNSSQLGLRVKHTSNYSKGVNPMFSLCQGSVLDVWTPRTGHPGSDFGRMCKYIWFKKAKKSHRQMIYTAKYVNSQNKPKSDFVFTWFHQV